MNQDQLEAEIQQLKGNIQLLWTAHTALQSSLVAIQGLNENRIAVLESSTTPTPR